MAIHLYIVYGYFDTIMAELSRCCRNCVTHKVIYKNIYNLAFYKKSLATPSWLLEW